jgi:hypothetical protein
MVIFVELRQHFINVHSNQKPPFISKVFVYVRSNCGNSQRLFWIDCDFDVNFVVAFQILLLFLVKVKIFHNLVCQFVVSFHAEQVIAVKKIDPNAFHGEFFVRFFNFLH